MIKTYYRLTKPGIIYGNVLTGAGGFLLASNGRVNFSLLAAALSGMALVIASACVFNNFIDCGLDAKMERTQKRALVSGAIGPRSAILYASFLGLAGFTLLTVYTNLTTAGIGLAAFISYIVFYGIAKRRSIHGTLVGSVPGAASIVAGYTAASGRLDTGAFLLFLIMATWQMPHFYAIAIYRLKDYRAAGLPVLPAVKGIPATRKQMLAYVIAFIFACSLLTIYGYAGYAFWAVMSLAGLNWLRLGLQGLRQAANDVRWARQMFGFSLIVLLTLSVMLALNSYLP